LSWHGAKVGEGHQHEQSDAATRPIFQLVVGLGVFVAISMVLMAMLYRFFNAYETARDTPVSPLAQEEPAMKPGPKLQPSPTIDLQQFRAKEKQALESFGWVDQREQLVHIPIEKAIELMAERGLPARADAPAADSSAPAAAPAQPAPAQATPAPAAAN
jgi:hypothetical protein